MWQRWLYKRVIDSTSVRYLENYCLHTRNKNATCTSCIDICPTEAFELRDGKIQFNESKCNDCKLCIQQCPTNALYLEREMLNQYEKKIITRETVCFTCEKQKTSSDDVLIPCLSSLTPELILIALMHKKSVQIYYDPYHCNDCLLNKDLEKSIDWIQEIDYISYGDVKIINEVYEKRAKKKDLTRRELFSFTKTKTKEEVGTLLLDSFDSSLTVKNKLPLPERRKYLAEFVNREQKERYLSQNLAKGLKLMKLSVDPLCDLCSRCTQLCPTGALKLVKNDSVMSLTYQAIQCINCEICSRSCSYIDLSVDTCLCIGLTIPKIKKSDQYKECSSCGDKIIATLPLCKDCFDIKDKREDLLSNW